MSATTYWFSSKEEIFREAVALAAGEEVERFERLVLDLAPRHVAPADWAREVSAALAADVQSDPARPIALYEFLLEAARQPALREEVARWEQAQLRLAEAGLRAAGSDDPETDAHVVVATITGLILGQLTTPRTRLRAHDPPPRARASVHTPGAVATQTRAVPRAFACHARPPCPCRCHIRARYTLTTCTADDRRSPSSPPGSTASSRYRQLIDLGLDEGGDPAPAARRSSAQRAPRRVRGRSSRA